MNAGLLLILTGLASMAAASVWLFGPWGLAAAGLVLIVAGLVPDWERVYGVRADKTSQR